MFMYRRVCLCMGVCVYVWACVFMYGRVCLCIGVCVYV